MSREFHLITYGLIVGYAAFMTWINDGYEDIVDHQQATVETMLYSLGCAMPGGPSDVDKA